MSSLKYSYCLFSFSHKPLNTLQEGGWGGGENKNKDIHLIIGDSDVLNLGEDYYNIIA